MDTKIEALKQELSQYETKEILGMIGIHFLHFGNNGEEIATSADPFTKTSLVSPQKQYTYLAGLLMSTADLSHGKSHNSGDYFQKLEDQVQQITTDYAKGFTKIDAGALIDHPEEIQKNFVSAEAFTSYFDMGTLRYEEQTIDLIRCLYGKFDNELLQLTSLNVSDYLDFYNYIKSRFQDSFSLVQELIERSLEAKEQSRHMSKGDIESVLSAIDAMSTVKTADIISRFGEDKADILIDTFSIERKNRDFKYYNGKNPFARQPLSFLDEQTLFVVHPCFLLDAIYNWITDKIEASQNSFAERYKKWKGECIEDLFLLHLKSLIGLDATYHTCVCEKKGTNEHDILIELGDYIIIAEVKASKVREPFFNPQKAYKRLYDHFHSDVGIGGAYKQAIILKNFLENADNQTLYENKTNPFNIHNISQKKILPFVLTLNQFGGLAINSSDILEIDETEPYPWVCNLSDIENICNIFLYLNKSAEDFIKYVQWRIDNHSRIYSSDELDVLEAYCFSKDLREQVKSQNIILLPNGPQLIDKIYFEKHNIPYTYSAAAKYSFKKTGVNDLCPCGSGRKYKKCCRKKEYSSKIEVYIISNYNQ